MKRVRHKAVCIDIEFVQTGTLGQLITALVDYVLIAKSFKAIVCDNG
jgi:hypothetical protein